MEDAEVHGIFLVGVQDGLDQTEPVYRVPLTMYQENRDKLCMAMTNAGHDSGLIFLKGGVETPSYSGDAVRVDFRQESYFSWLFGCQEDSCLGVVDIESKKSTLFIPRLPESYKVWVGQIFPTSWFKTKYAVDTVRYCDEIEAFMEDFKESTIFVLKGINSDSDSSTEPATFKGIESYKVDTINLHDIFAECRVIKSAAELDLLRYVNRVSSRAHVRLMQSVKPKMGEHQAEARFLFDVYNDGACRHVSYRCISATGVDGATLHYPHNSKAIQPGSMCLFDMGGEYLCYGADITCSFPANGKFTQNQRDIYNIVLQANRAVLSSIAPGVNWVDMHVLANRVLLKGLKDIGIVTGDLDGMMAANLAALFFPHGLGHLLGLDVHDVGGYLPGCPPRPSPPGLKSLRMARDLEEGMFITIEPGCYFMPDILAEAFENENFKPFLNEPMIREHFWTFGGVRIEDDVAVTARGCELFTLVPRSVEEIEKVMAGAEFRVSSTIFYENV